ncbi:MAG: S8 family serine peptidase [Saprospiraceae bacterium]
MSKILTTILILSLSVLHFAKAQHSPKFTKSLERQIAQKAVGEQLSVWIYFTDKGDDLAQKIQLAEQTISERALERRKKTMGNKPLVTLLDVPVSDEYLQQVIPYITKHRHSSKWLNALSADIKISNLQEVADLDFIQKIDIVRKGKRTNIDLSNSLIANINADTKVEKTGFYDLEYGQSLTQLEQMNVPMVHDMGFTGDGLLICVMDAGFRNYNNISAFSTMDIMATYDFVNDDENVDDQSGDMGTGGHGTYSLSTIGAFVEDTLIGPAFGATYLLAKTENTESETTAEEDHWVAAAEWAEGLGADITSTSLGYLFFDDGSGYPADSLDGNTATITIAGDIMADLGVLVVNSAGNSGNGTTTIGAPADGNNVFAIGAVNAAGNKSGFSSVGPTADGRIKPDVMAMGTAVRVQRWDGFFTNVNGTSFSCPLAAGAAALLWEMVPSATNFEIMESLRMTASNADDPNNQIGWGIINLLEAYEYLLENDEVAPEAVCQDAVLYLDENGMTTELLTTDLDNGSVDNISVDSFALDNNTFTCADVGENVVQLFVFDQAGNPDTCVAMVAIQDTLAPVPAFAELDSISAECSVNSLVFVTAMDNCGGIVAGVSDINIPIEMQGNFDMNWEYDDGFGNVTTQSQIIQIEDVTDPIALTQNITVDLAGNPTVTIQPEQINNGSTDNCQITDIGIDVNTFDAVGDYTVILMVTDINNNTATETATVKVIDSFAIGTSELLGTKLSLYPNPASDFVQLDFDNNTLTSVNIDLYTTDGKLIKSIESYNANNKITTSDLPKGTYLLKVQSKDNSTVLKLTIN